MSNSVLSLDMILFEDENSFKKISWLKSEWLLILLFGTISENFVLIGTQEVTNHVLVPTGAFLKNKGPDTFLRTCTFDVAYHLSF